MKIRAATSDDLATVIDLGAQLQQESKKYEPLLAFDWQGSYDHYAKELENDNARIIVAVNADGEIIGYQYSFISVLDYLSDNNVECTFEAVYVKPEYRRQGVAKKLLQDPEQWAINKGASRIKAGIYTGNIASEEAHLNNGFNPYYTEYIKIINET